MRRGDTRWALLEALEEGPAHGYELINRLEERSGGMWRPSPGSVYPTLQMLEDEGLVQSEEREGKRVYETTEAGRAVAAERASVAASQGPGEDRGWGPGRHRGLHGFRHAGEKVGPVVAPMIMATRQLAMVGDDEKLDRGLDIIRKATRELYQILAEG